MDTIKYLVSGADPVGGDSDVPDGERILQDILAAPEAFMDRVPVHVPTLAERRRRRGKVAGLLAVAAAAVTAGVLLTTSLVPGQEAPAPAATNSMEPFPVSSASPPSTPAPSQSASPATQAATAHATTPPVAPADDWPSYASTDGKISFDYPPDWTVLPKPSSQGYPAIALDVQDQAGKTVASLHYGASGGLGGGCASPVAYAVLDSVELALPYNASFPDVITPRFAFRALLEGDRVTASYGITSTAAGKDGTSCMFYNVVNGPPESPTYAFSDVFQVRAGDGGGMSFRTLDEARAYMLTPEYINAKRMITSLKIRNGA